MRALTVAALYVDAAGCYAGLSGVDPWPIERDARRYAGPHRWRRTRKTGRTADTTREPIMDKWWVKGDDNEAGLWIGIITKETFEALEAEEFAEAEGFTLYAVSE